jgi:hypothetical protein
MYQVMGMRGIIVVDMTFDEQVYHDIGNSAFHKGYQNFWSVLDHLNRNNIRKNSDRINFIKKWFLAGHEAHVNGSCSGRIVLKYQPELLKLLKVGFIEQVRYQRYTHKKRLCEGKISKNAKYYHNQTVLKLKIK